MSEPHRVINVRRGAATERWLEVYVNRIELHIENDGWAFVRHGAEARVELVDIYFVRQNWPQLVDQVEAAQVELDLNRNEETDMFETGENASGTWKKIA